MTEARQQAINRVEYLRSRVIEERKIMRGYLNGKSFTQLDCMLLTESSKRASRAIAELDEAQKQLNEIVKEEDGE